jgi:3-phosphoshikimate 1-carboxyvinyltransferase
LVARTIDEYPILAIAAALAQGSTTFADVKELRFKESDRIVAMSEGLRALGVKVEARDDSMTIHGGARLQGGAVRSFADHRIAMSFAVAGLVSATGVAIDDERCAAISFPTFFDLLEDICLH